jgi:hypothetical protein
VIVRLFSLMMKRFCHRKTGITRIASPIHVIRG